MPIETKKVENLPLVIATLTGHITGEEVEQMYKDTEALLGDIEGNYYRISDVRDADTNFPDFMKILGSLKQDGKFRTSDPNMTAIFLGNNDWIHNIRNVVEIRGIHMPAFQTMEEAMTYVEIAISENETD